MKQFVFKRPRKVSYELRTHPRGFYIFSPPSVVESDPVPLFEEKEKPTSAKQVIAAKFELPNIVQLRIYTSFFNSVLFFSVVPTGENTCRVDYMVSKVLPFGFKLSYTEDEPLVMKQDREIMESSQEVWYICKSYIIMCSTMMQNLVSLLQKVLYRLLNVTCLRILCIFGCVICLFNNNCIKKFHTSAKSLIILIKQWDVAFLFQIQSSTNRYANKRRGIHCSDFFTMESMFDSVIGIQRMVPGKQIGTPCCVST